MNQSAPWDNSHPLTIDEIANIVSLQFPRLHPVQVQPLGQGWDNTTWIINGKWIFRFPKHKGAAELIQNELRLLPLLQHLPLKIPTPEFIGKPDEFFPYSFYGHEILIGNTADHCCLSNQARGALAKPLAQFLKTLHSFPISDALAIGIKYDEYQRLNIQLRFDKTCERIAYLLEQKLIPSVAPWLTFFSDWQTLATPDLQVLGHGDFYAKHLILNENLELAGIIDWGDAELIHPALDLAIVYQFLPLAAQEIFWHNYGEVTDTTKLLAKLRAIYSAVTTVWYAHQVHDAMLMQEGLQGLAFLAEILLG